MQRWSFKLKVLFPTTKRKELEITIRPWVLKLLLAFLISLFSVFGFALYRYLSFEIDYQRVSSLEKENTTLKKELKALKSKAEKLNELITGLFQENNRLRTAVGLDPVPKEIALMGMGGNLEELPNPGKDEKAYVKQEIERLINLANFQLQSYSEIAKKFEEDQTIREHTPSIVPAAGYFTSGFGMRRDPFTGFPAFHEGIDISAPPGTPVIAPASGVVTSVKWEQGYGLVVEIDHGLGIKTRYAHLLRARVSPGQYVKRGDIIAYVGNSGRSTAPHLHYEVRINDKPVNPVNYIIPAGTYYD
jgi:murein DD-endopeptidase MepM/ murein hydrolase activator NlpD